MLRSEVRWLAQTITDDRQRSNVESSGASLDVINAAQISAMSHSLLGALHTVLHTRLNEGQS